MSIIKLNSPIVVNTSSEFPVQIPSHTHLHYEIYFFRGGKCNYVIGDKLYTLVPGDLLLMHGLTFHCPNVDPITPYHRTTINFDPVYISKLIAPPFSINVLEPFQKLQNYRLQLRDKNKQQVEDMIDMLQGVYSKNDLVAFHRVHVLLLDMLLLIYDFCQQSLEHKPHLPSTKEHYVELIISFIENNYFEDIHLDQLEKHLHLSKYYIVRIFKEMIGLTIFDYIIQRRINQAKILMILDKNKSITDICYEIGFKYPSHFSRAFKLLVGCSPNLYRKIYVP